MPATPHLTPRRLRVAAISFLNPAPLLWNFEHEPAAAELRTRYDVTYTLPALCAAQLASGEADLGLIPIAALATLPEVAAVPGLYDRVVARSAVDPAGAAPGAHPSRA